MRAAGPGWHERAGAVSRAYGTTEATVERTARRRQQRQRADRNHHIDATPAETLRVDTVGRVVAAAEDLRAAFAAAAAPGDEQNSSAQNQRENSPQRRVTHGHPSTTVRSATNK